MIWNVKERLKIFTQAIILTYDNFTKIVKDAIAQLAIDNLGIVLPEYTLVKGQPLGDYGPEIDDIHFIENNNADNEIQEEDNKQFEFSTANQVSDISEHVNKEKIICFNKSDLLSQEDKRKISSYLQSKKFSFCLISTKAGENLDELKQLLLKNSGVIFL